MFWDILGTFWTQPTTWLLFKRWHYLSLIGFFGYIVGTLNRNSQSLDWSSRGRIIWGFLGTFWTQLAFWLIFKKLWSCMVMLEITRSKTIFIVQMYEWDMTYILHWEQAHTHLLCSNVTSGRNSVVWSCKHDCKSKEKSFLTSRTSWGTLCIVRCIWGKVLKEL